MNTKSYHIDINFTKSNVSESLCTSRYNKFLINPKDDFDSTGYQTMIQCIKRRIPNY